MALKTQESQLYFIDPSATPAEVVELKGLKRIDGLDAAISSVETTTLASDHREYIPGIAEPGTASIKMNYEPGDDSQTTLHALKNAGTTLQWALGKSDGTIAPELDTDGKSFKQTAVARTFLYFSAFPTSWASSFDVNGVEEIDAGAQLNDRTKLVAKA